MREKTCRAAVFEEAGKPLSMRDFPLPETLEPGAALCRVKMSTVCGSDLHTITGRRKESAPLILGHEILGEIVALGSEMTRDGFGDTLAVGDRVSWSIMAFCGQCYYCQRRLPQKCEHLRKYGHSCCNDWPPLTGGYAEYVHLLPGTAVFRVPDLLPDNVATPANCALATVVNAAEAIGLDAGENVLIQGAGLLGVNLIALAVEAGARTIIVTDANPQRLTMAERFGAGLCLDAGALSGEEIALRIGQCTDGRGVDVAFEVCGAKEAVVQGVEALRIGGRYLIAGLVTPGSMLGLDGNQVTRKCLTIKGVHNYRPEHLGTALQFLAKCSERYPYADLVGETFPLSRINDAIDAAASGRYLRVAVIPEHPAGSGP